MPRALGSAGHVDAYSQPQRRGAADVAVVGIAGDAGDRRLDLDHVDVEVVAVALERLEAPLDVQVLVHLVAELLHLGAPCSRRRRSPGSAARVVGPVTCSGTTPVRRELRARRPRHCRRPHASASAAAATAVRQSHPCPPRNPVHQPLTAILRPGGARVHPTDVEIRRTGDGRTSKRLRPSRCRPAAARPPGRAARARAAATGRPAVSAACAPPSSARGQQLVAERGRQRLGDPVAATARRARPRASCGGAR